MTPALELTGYGVAFGAQVVLSDVSFALAPHSMTVLVGPAGVGKSTLARTLAGLNDRHASLLTWGRARCGGNTLDVERPRIVGQHARFYLDTVRENLVSALRDRAVYDRAAQTRIVCAHLELSGLSQLATHLEREVVELPLSLQRRLALARALLEEPAVLFVDEPTAGLDDEDALALVDVLRDLSERRAIVLITHNQRHALAAGGTTLLLADGAIRACEPTARFFTTPYSALANQFARTGGCITDAPKVKDSPSVYEGPRGFFWIEPGKLGGLPRPGIIAPLEHDLDGLQRLGVDVLVTLEETPTVDPGELARRGIAAIHFPIVDGSIPAVLSATELCSLVAGAIASGKVVAMHCRAGLGRTGTLLACQLIAGGTTARAALEAVRAVQPRAVQTPAQVDFLRSFEAAKSTGTTNP